MEDQRPENIVDELADDAVGFAGDAIPWKVKVPIGFKAEITANFSGLLASTVTVQWGNETIQIGPGTASPVTLTGEPGVDTATLSPTFFGTNGVPIPPAQYYDSESQTGPDTFVFNAGLLEVPGGFPPEKVGITIVVEEIILPIGDDTP
jgi:hypothetical protein